MEIFITKQPDGSVHIQTPDMVEVAVIEPEDMASVITALQEILDEQE